MFKGRKNLPFQHKTLPFEHINITSNPIPPAKKDSTIAGAVDIYQDLI